MSNKKINASISNLLFKSIAMVIVLISVTFSWFVFTTDSNPESILSGVSKAGSVSISTDGEKWGSGFVFLYSGRFCRKQKGGVLSYIRRTGDI